MNDHAVFEIEIKENGEVAFNKLASGAERFKVHADKARESAFDLDRTFDRLKTTLFETAGVFAAFSFAKSSEDYYLNVKRADAEINASLKSTQDAAGVTNQQLEQSAESLYHHSESSLDRIKNMQAVLLTFPSVTKDTFGEAQQAIVDMTAKLYGSSGDAREVAIQVGKALQDPATGMMMLRREGVNFTKQQTEMVKAMVDSGHKVEAQRYILHELAVEFGGSAEAAYEAGGAHEQFAKTTEDLKLQVGSFVDKLETDLVPVLSLIIGDVQKAVEWGEKHKDLIEGTVKVVGLLAAAFVAYNIATKVAVVTQELWVAGQALAAGYTAAEAAEVAGLTTAMEALDVAMDANPIGIMAAAIVGLAGAYMLLSQDIDYASDAKKKWDEQGKEDFQNMTDNERAAQYGELTKKIDEAQEDIKMAQQIRALDIARGYDTSIQDKFILGQKKLISELAKEKKEMMDVVAPKSDKAGKTPGISTSGATPRADSVKADTKQIVNTWNIREFGKTVVNAKDVNEAADSIHDKFNEILTSAVNDSQIASGQ